MEVVRWHRLVLVARRLTISLPKVLPRRFMAPVLSMLSSNF